MWKKNFSSFKPYWQLTVMIFLMTIVSGLCHQTSVLEWFRFWGFQMFCLFIPGIAVMILIPMRNLKSVEKVLYSYALGYMLTIVFYLFIMLTVGSKFLKIFFAVMAIAALVFVCYHVMHAEIEDVTEEADDRVWIWTILTVFMISLIVASLRWRLPYIGQRNSYDGDYLDWVRKIETFKRDGSVFIQTIKNSPYHYLGMIQQAAAAKITNISAFGMASQYSHIESSVFLGLSSYAIVNRLIKNRKAQIVTLILLLFSTGFESKSVVTYIWHIYLVPMSYHIAQSLGVMVILLILIQLDEEFDFHKLLVTVALLVCCTGTKGATGAVIFGGITLACLYMFFIQKREKMALAYFICAFVGFGLVYAYLMPTAQIFSDQAFQTFGEANSEETVDTIADGTVNGAVAGSFLGKGAEKLGGYIKYFIYVNPWTMLSMVVLIGYSVAHRSIKREYLILFAMTMAGTMFGYFIHFYGHSEMYFTLTVYPFAALLAGCLLEIVFSRNISVRGQSAIMVVLCSAAVFFTVFFDYHDNFRKCLIKGLDNLWIFHDNVIEYEHEGFFLSYDEFFAYDWIRTHTQPDALVLTNRLRVAEEWNLFLSLTERDLASIEGDLKEDEEFEQFSGVDYVVFNKDLGEFECPSDKGKILFENKLMIVCELY